MKTAVLTRPGSDVVTAHHFHQPRGAPLRDGLGQFCKNVVFQHDVENPLKFLLLR